MIELEVADMRREQLCVVADHCEEQVVVVALEQHVVDGMLVEDRR